MATSSLNYILAISGTAAEKEWTANTERIKLISTVACYVKIASTGDATTNDFLLPANTIETFNVRTAGSGRVSAITAGGTGNLHIAIEV